MPSSLVFKAIAAHRSLAEELSALEDRQRTEAETDEDIRALETVSDEEAAAFAELSARFPETAAELLRLLSHIRELLTQHPGLIDEMRSSELLRTISTAGDRLFSMDFPGATAPSIG